MKLMMFDGDDGRTPRLGVVEGGALLDVARADPALPCELAALIAAGPGALRALATAATKAPAADRRPLDAVRPALPIAAPRKFICVGLNYALHAKEGGHPLPTYPSFFLRVPTSLVAAKAPVVCPKASAQLDYECELAVVIGTAGRHIAEARALDHVFG
jgi:acylpyruvate hydrolase